MVTQEVDVVFLIADLAGYTALTEAHGNLHAADAVRRYAEIAGATLQPGARLVERVGDEVLIVAQDAAVAVRTAVVLRAAVEREPLFPTLRSGLHAGSVVQQGAHYFGGALNLTSRVAAHARAGQILCTEPVATRAARLNDIDYQPLGLVRFKNIVDPLQVFEVVAGHRSSESTAIDPVCRMQVRPHTAPAKLPFGGKIYHFCSFDCARAFAAHPEAYVGAPSS
jgi:adenylate cyclase